MSHDATPPPPGTVTMERYENARVMSLRGEHDVSSAAVVRDLLAEARATGGLILVDLTAATFIDSTIAVSLFEGYLADRPPRVRFVVPAGTQPRLVFDRIGAATGLPIYDNLRNALADQAAS